MLEYEPVYKGYIKTKKLAGTAEQPIVLEPEAPAPEPSRVDENNPEPTSEMNILRLTQEKVAGTATAAGASAQPSAAKRASTGPSGKQKKATGKEKQSPPKDLALNRKRKERELDATTHVDYREKPTAPKDKGIAAEPSDVWNPKMLKDGNLPILKSESLQKDPSLAPHLIRSVLLPGDINVPDNQKKYCETRDSAIFHSLRVGPFRTVARSVFLVL